MPNASSIQKLDLFLINKAQFHRFKAKSLPSFFCLLNDIFDLLDLKATKQYVLELIFPSFLSYDLVSGSGTIDFNNNEISEIILLP